MSGSDSISRRSALEMFFFKALNPKLGAKTLPPPRQSAGFAEKGLAALVGGLGLLILVGWWFSPISLKSIYPGDQLPKPNIGAFLFISGSALGLLSRRPASRGIRLTTAVLAGLLVFLSLLTLAEAICGIDFTIDQLVVAGRSSPTPDWSWRMMPGTAFSFAIVGVALLVAAQRPSRLRTWLVCGLSTSQLIPAIAGLGGFAVECILGAQWNLLGMSATGTPIALAFIFLSSGLLLLLHRSGEFRWSLGGLTTGGFVFGIVLVIATAASAFSFAKQMLQTNRIVTQRQETLKEIEEIASAIAGLNSSERGYIITGDEKLLAGREQSIAGINENLGNIRRLTTDYRRQQDAVTALQAQVSKHLDWEEEIIRSRAQGIEAAAKLMSNGEVLDSTNRIDSALREMRNTEYALRDIDVARADKASSATFLLLPLGVFLTLATLSLGFSFLNSGMTERSLSEEALRQAEKKYRSIFENAVEGIFQTGLDGKIISANPALARISGYDNAGELIQAVSDIRTLYADTKQREQLRELVDGDGMVRDFECEFYRREGSKIWVSLNMRAVRDPNGEAIYYEGTAQEISERKRAAELERANGAKSEFLSRMSHELRTPLNAILGFGQLLERQRPTPTQEKYLGHITTAGRHLLNLINEVLEISRIEAGRLQMSIGPVPVAEVLAETVDLIKPLALEHAIKLEPAVNLDSKLQVMADRQRLKQVLINLLGNAVKYTPMAGTVTCAVVGHEGSALRINISDNGPGIPDDKLSRLFSPFDRLGAEQSTVEGTGLGLALCRRLTQAMNGTIGVDSKVGHGSTFWVELPLAESNPTAPAPVLVG